MVKNRFLNMKDTFIENHRKVRKSKQRCSGKSPEEIFKPRRILYSHLQFLQKAVAQSKIISKFAGSSQEVSSVSKSIELITPIEMYYDEMSQVLNDFKAIVD